MKRLLPLSHWPLPALSTGFLLAVASCVNAVDVQWFSSFFQENRDSEDEPLDEGWTFHLGYFSSSFVPTSGNTAEWAAHWQQVDSTAYQVTGSRFAGQWANDGSVTGRPAYIWGLNRQRASNEWILLHDASWNFPFAGGIAPPVNWAAGDAGEVIVGALNAGGVHLRTEAVEGEPFEQTYPIWLQTYFTDEELSAGTLTGASDDADGDGQANAVEFAFATNPRDAASRAGVMVAKDTSGEIVFSAPRARATAVSLFPQVSPDLVLWLEDSSLEVLASSSSELLFRSKLDGNQAFARVRVELP
ncbi:MAG: hypothetical protein Q7Q71_03400 [Verrucomicrobiota bacterium JB023]|nr:hypothetical protein [Verrucomicrobiota bacterium JB023]